MPCTVKGLRSRWVKGQGLSGGGSRSEGRTHGDKSRKWKRNQNLIELITITKKDGGVGRGQGGC